MNDSHVSDESFDAYVSDVLDAAARALLEAHVAACEPCEHALLRHARAEQAMYELAPSCRAARRATAVLRTCAIAAGSSRSSGSGGRFIRKTHRSRRGSTAPTPCVPPATPGLRPCSILRPTTSSSGGPARPLDNKPPARAGGAAWTALLIAGVALMLYVPDMGSSGLWDPWEGHYAEVARQMLERGDLIEPHWHNGTGPDGRKENQFWSKPALTFWMMAGGLAAAGLNRPDQPGEMVLADRVEWAVRAPSCCWARWGSSPWPSRARVCSAGERVFSPDWCWPLRPSTSSSPGRR